MPEDKKTKLFLKQPQMNRVLYVLTAVFFSAVYFFGWRVLAVVAVCFAAGFITEYIMCKRTGQSVSTACFVTCSLYSLSLPATIPLWVAAVGVIVALLFGKMVFGGFGRNFVNPAILGRAFVYVCFPIDMTARFVPAFEGFPGGFAKWSFASLDKLPQAFSAGGTRVADAISQASPMWINREFGHEISIFKMLFGNISGLFQQGDTTRIISAGSMGEGCAVLIAMAAVYLLWTKTAKYQLMLGGFIGFIVTNLLLRNVMGFSGVGEVPPVYVNLFSGTSMYVMVFMITDPVSAPRKVPAMWAYGLLIGCMAVFLRWRGIFVAAFSFSVLLGNIIGPLLDQAATWWSQRKAAQ